MANKNSYLWEILSRIPKEQVKRILDIGGARFGGDESVSIMRQIFPEAMIDVQASKKESREELIRKFGSSLGFPEPAGPGEGASYDLVVLLPPQAAIVGTWLTFDSKFGQFLRPGGIVVGLGVLPGALSGNPDLLTPDPALRQRFAEVFCPEEGHISRLPDELDGYRFLGCIPWRKTGRSYLSLMVLQKSRES